MRVKFEETAPHCCFDYLLAIDIAYDPAQAFKHLMSVFMSTSSGRWRYMVIYHEHFYQCLFWNNFETTCQALLQL